MQFANHFREPAAGVSRCEYKTAVSCLSRFPEELSSKMNSKLCREIRLAPLSRQGALSSADERLLYAAIWVVPRLETLLIVPEIHAIMNLRDFLFSSV
jgi:hypothetical protein